MRNKRAALQSPASIVALGFQLMGGADAATTEFAAQRAVAFRVGLMIALLAYRPMDTQKHLPLPEGKPQFRAVAGCE